MPQKKQKRKRKGKKKSNAWVTMIVVVLLVGLVGGAYWFTSQDIAGTVPVKLYFVNTSTNKWQTETRRIKANLKKTEALQETLSQLVAGPKSSTLGKSVTSPTLITLGSLLEESKTFTVKLSEEYYALGSTESIVCLNAIVYTLTEFDYVDNVHFYVGDAELLRPNGQPYGMMNRDNVLLGDAPISPDTVNTREVVVYFSDEQALALVAEKRSVEMSVNKQPERYVVEELLKGPTASDLYAVIPADTKLRGVSTEGDTCYVDFSQDFLSKFDGGSSAERLMVYSIVNSLTELSNIKRVKILAGGDTILDTKGFSLDLSKPFERDAELIAQ